MRGSIAIWHDTFAHEAEGYPVQLAALVVHRSI
jgi:hypothetical protein